VRAGFILTGTPAADLDPPRLVELDLAQRFDPLGALTVTWVFSDAGAVDLGATVQLGKSPDRPLPTELLEHNRFQAVIEPQGALGVSLAYTATDEAGNWLAWQPHDGASSLAQVPVTLTFSLDPPRVPWGYRPVQVRIIGSLVGPGRQPLAEGPVWLSLSAGGRHVGYVRDVSGIAGDYQTGTIFFPWTFVPRDLSETPGSLPISLAFDVGLYATQVVTRSLELLSSSNSYLPLVLRGLAP
jgi:hypothetical protein